MECRVKRERERGSLRLMVESVEDFFFKVEEVNQKQK